MVIMLSSEFERLLPFFRLSEALCTLGSCLVWSAVSNCVVGLGSFPLIIFAHSASTSTVAASTVAKGFFSTFLYHRSTAVCK